MALALNARLEIKRRGPSINKLCTICYRDSSVAFCIGRGGKLCLLLKTVETSSAQLMECTCDIYTWENRWASFVLTGFASRRKCFCGQNFSRRNFPALEEFLIPGQIWPRATTEWSGVTRSAYTNTCVSQNVLHSADRVCPNTSPPLPLRQVSLRQDQRCGCLPCSGRIWSGKQDREARGQDGSRHRVTIFVPGATWRQMGPCMFHTCRDQGLRNAFRCVCIRVREPLWIGLVRTQPL